jgi:hypothetical protein
MPGALMLNVGVDYERWLYATSRYVTFVPDARDLASPWRLTLSLSKRIAIFKTRNPSADLKVSAKTATLRLT